MAVNTIMEEFFNDTIVQQHPRTNATNVRITPTGSETLTQRLATINTDIDGAITHANTLDAATRGVIGNLNSLHDRITSRGNLVAVSNQLESRIQDLHNRANAFDGTVTLANQLNTRVGQLSDINNQFPSTARTSIVNALNNVSNRLRESDARIADVENNTVQSSTLGNLNDLGNRFVGTGRSTIVGALNALDGRTHTAQTDINALNTRVNGLLGSATTIGNIALGNFARRDVGNTFAAAQIFNGNVDSRNNLIIRQGATQRGSIVGTADGMQLRGGTGANGPVITASGNIETRNVIRLRNASSSSSVIDFWRGNDNSQRFRLNMQDNGRFVLSTSWNGSATRNVFAVEPGQVVPNFNNGLSIQGRRIFIQSGTPSGASSGDIWIW